MLWFAAIWASSRKFTTLAITRGLCTDIYQLVILENCVLVQKFKTLLIAELSKVFPNEMAKYRSLRGDERL